MRLRRLRCFLRRPHVWENHQVQIAGVLTIVPRCNCGRVDVDRIRQSPWNRKARRKRAKRLGML